MTVNDPEAHCTENDIIVCDDGKPDRVAYRAEYLIVNCVNNIEYKGNYGGKKDPEFLVIDVSCAEPCLFYKARERYFIRDFRLRFSSFYTIIL